MARHIYIILISILLAVLPVKAARIDTIVAASSFLPFPDTVLVIVPTAATSDSFPTAYLLHGYADTYRSWLRIRPDLPELADRYGMIMVMPQGYDSWYWDSPANPSIKMESFITQDLVNRIDSLYPTRRDPAQRAITGLSMGGHGAMWLAMRHPDIWQNVGSTSGGLDIRPFPNRWKISTLLGSQEEFPQNWEEYTVITRIPENVPEGLNIIFDCGTSDFFYDVNNNMHRALETAGIPHDYISRPGGHSAAYWANSILYHLMFFNEQFAK